jgi:RHS repeat-associated protein
MGNRTQEQVFDPSSTLAQTRSRVFNNLSRLYRDLGALSQFTEYTYDNQGNVASVKDPLNHTTANQYDALNRLKQATDPGTGVTHYAYDGIDQLVSVTDPRTLATTYAITGLGNLVTQVSPDTGTTGHTHDAAGNLLTQTDAKSQVTTYTYDALNRVATVTFHDASSQTFGYDSGANGIGRLTSITERNAASTIIAQTGYAYDQHGRLTSDTRTINAVAYVTAYRYNSSGKLDRVTYPSGRTVDYSFDSLGRVSAVATTPSGGSASNLATGITYHPFGGLKAFTFGNSQSYARSYDQDGRISTYSLGGSDFVVAYDNASRITSISEVTVPANINSYVYDVLDRLTSADTPVTDYAYTYDPTGNRLTRVAGLTTDIYAIVSTSNRINTITPPSGPTRTFTFDANGSTTADGNNTYAYDVKGRMASATSGFGATTYQVNALGQRIRKTNSLTDRVFTYDAQGHLIAEHTAVGALLKEYVWLGDTPLATIDSTGTYFIHVDHLNTPRLVANATGQTVWRWDQQEPFGNNPADQNPSGLGVFDLPLRLPGQTYDVETGLHYNYFRDYDPTVGRYGESDPIGLRGGLNTYAYVHASPLKYGDKFGLQVPFPIPPLPVPPPPIPGVPGLNPPGGGVVIPFPTPFPTPQPDGQTGRQNDGAANDDICIGQPKKRCTFTGIAELLPWAALRGHIVRCQYRCPTKGIGYYDLDVGRSFSTNPNGLCPIELDEASVRPASFWDSLF